MPEATRQLAAIMFTDIVGYTALMGENENNALTILRKNKKIHQKWLEKFNGKWLKEMGDGVLASFQSVIDAVHCAGAILAEVKEIEDLDLRIGIHLGDVVIEGNEIYGDGVNVTSRIQNIAENNQIVVSDSLAQNLKNKEGLNLTLLGEKDLKNVLDPVKVYLVDFDSDMSFSNLITQDRKSLKSTIIWIVVILIATGAFFTLNYYLKENPNENQVAEANIIKSIAVLPFDNLTGDTAQDHLVAGMQDILITTLSQITSLTVISKTSTLSYKNREDKTIQQIANELDVDAIIETSVLRSMDSLRINVQLIQAFPIEKHLWARIFDRPFKNIEFLFDDVARGVAEDISRALNEGGQPRLSEPKEINPEAYKAYMNGKFLSITIPSPENLEKALEYFQRAIELDSTFAPAYAEISWVWISFFQLGYATGIEAIPKIYANNSKAIELDPYYPDAQYHKAVISFQTEWDWEKSEKAFLKALELNPNHAMAHAHYSHLLMYRQRYEEALPHMEIAMKLDPLNPHVLGLCAIVYWYKGDFDKALEISNKNSDIFGKPVIEESIAYLKGDSLTSIQMLERRFGEDSALVKALRSEFKENGYKYAMNLLGQTLEKKNAKIPAVEIAIFYNRAGMIDDAIRVLEDGFKNHDPNMPYAFLPIELENLESDPRYRDLADKMNLPF